MRGSIHQIPEIANRRSQFDFYSFFACSGQIQVLWSENLRIYSHA